jgi:hypothetical protein
MTAPAIRPNDLALVEKQIADLLTAYPEIGEDEQLREDMVSGSTDLDSLLAVLLCAERDAAAMQTALNERIEDLKARKERFKRRQEGAKKMMQRLMESSGLKKKQLTEGTLSLAVVPPSVVIIDEFAIPPEFMRVKTEPDKAAIKDALKNAIEVPGCTLSNGGQSLRIL